VPQEGKVPKLDKILDDSDDEVVPDKEIQVPEHKVKLIVGAGGEKIKFIQKKSKCQVQVTPPPPLSYTNQNRSFGTIKINCFGSLPLRPFAPENV
jgi:hypothetical protein